MVDRDRRSTRVIAGNPVVTVTSRLPTAAATDPVGGMFVRQCHGLNSPERRCGSATTKAEGQPARPPLSSAIGSELGRAQDCRSGPTLAGRHISKYPSALMRPVSGSSAMPISNSRTSPAVRPIHFSGSSNTGAWPNRNRLSAVGATDDIARATPMSNEGRTFTSFPSIS